MALPTPQSHHLISNTNHTREWKFLLLSVKLRCLGSSPSVVEHPQPPKCRDKLREQVVVHASGHLYFSPRPLVSCGRSGGAGPQGPTNSNTYHQALHGARGSAALSWLFMCWINFRKYEIIYICWIICRIHLGCLFYHFSTLRGHS